MTRQERAQFWCDVVCASIQGQLANPNEEMRPQHMGDLHCGAVVCEAFTIADEALQALGTRKEIV